MPRRKQRGPAPGEWSYQVGEIPHQLTAFERTDKGLAVYTRVWDGKKYSRKRSLCPSIRDAKGNVVPEREIEAQKMAVRRHAELVAGADHQEDRPGVPLTLAAGFRKLLHPKEGKYPTDTGHRRDVVRASHLIKTVLGADRRMDTIKHRDYRALWRHIAHAHKRDGSYGPRVAELYCGALQTAARWLQREGHLESGDAVPAPGWKVEMREDWEKIAGGPIPEPEKPRYTDGESLKLWRAAPQADPRVHLAMEVGAELRLGQVGRVRRTDVFATRTHRIGGLQVHGRGKKRGETIILTMAQRHALTAALLWGYLAEAERAYQAGEIQDYHLFPGGRLHVAEDHRGRRALRVRVEGAARPISRRALARQWEKLEELAGVEHQAGRLWYGMRRLQADQVEALQHVPARVKNRMGGWTKTSTREGYLERANLKDAEEAAKARKMVRPKRIRRGSARDSDG